MGAYRILLIDDDPEERLLLEGFLRKIDTLPVELHACEGTAQAERLLEESGFDLIMADNRMAGDDKYVTGSNFLAYLIECGSQIPKILFSGAAPHLLHQDTQRFISNGDIVFLHKGTLNAAVLESVLASVLRQRPAGGARDKLHSFSRPVTPFDSFSAAAGDMIRRLQERFGFALAMMTRVQGKDWIVLDVVDRNYGVKSGDVLDWEESFCSQLVAGRGPMYTCDAQSVPAYRDAQIGRKLEINSYLGIPICRADGTLFGTLCAIDPADTDASIQDRLPEIMHDCRYLASILEDELRMESMLREKKRAELDAKTDGLTGLYNRRGWDTLLQAEEDRCRRYGHVGAIIMMDLDGLKLVNDRDGHEAGDELIQRASQALSDATRVSDIVARLGGDEFAVLAVETDLQLAEKLLARLREHMAAAGVSGSMGLAFRDPHITYAEAVALADERMYQDKRARKAGRNESGG